MKVTFQVKRQRKAASVLTHMEEYDDEVTRMEQEQAEWQRKAASSLLDDVTLSRSLQTKGATLAEAGRLREALEYFNNATRRDPTSAMAHEQVLA
jgi:predicted Zn-dependent protease